MVLEWINNYSRFKSALSVSHTFKLKKLKLTKEGFDLEIIDDSLFVLLPNELKYIPLTKELYQNIMHQKYSF
ncbi:MAG: hypothetical protein ACFFDK_04720 [Promethearchaeota archaeon]